jgi:hypothetical protein
MARNDGNDGSRIGVLVAVGLGIALVVGLGVYRQGRDAEQHEAMQKVAASMKSDIESIVSQSQDSQGMPRAIKPLATTPTAAGDDAGILRDYLTSVLNQSIALRNDYLAEITATGWDKALDPDRLRADKDLSQSLAMVAKAKAIVAKFRGRTHALMGDLRNQIMALKVDEAQKQSVLKGFDESTAKSAGSVDAQWDMEARIVDEVGGIFELLRDRQGQWQVNGREVLFRNQADLAAFNAHLAAVQEISRQEEQLRSQKMAKATSDLDELKKQ